MRPIAVPLLALSGLPLAADAQSNTAPTRSFTTEWRCANGRSLLVNAHPRRPREDLYLRYAGNRVELRLAGRLAERRYASADGKVSWTLDAQRATGTLTFEPLLDAPLRCKRVGPAREQP